MTRPEKAIRRNDNFVLEEEEEEKDPIYFVTRVRELCENKLRRVYVCLSSRETDTVLTQRR